MNDITALYYTGHLPPEPFLEKIRHELICSAAPYPIVSVSHRPIPDFGYNVAIGEHPKNFYTAQRQILIGLRCISTKYVALCEDDTLYPPDHFEFVPPKDNVFYYNTNRVVCEGKFYWYAHRSNMSQLVCNTHLLHNFMQRRMHMISGPQDPNLSYFSEPGRYKGKHDRHLGIMDTIADSNPFTKNPIVTFNLRKSLGKKRRISPNANIRNHVEPWGFSQALYDLFLKGYQDDVPEDKAEEA